MSDQPEDPSGTGEVTEEVAEQPVATWPEAGEGPAWSQIAAEAGSAEAGSAEAERAEPGAADSDSAEPGVPSEPAAGDAPSAPEAGRSRRPTSLRDQSKSRESAPGRSASTFASAPPAADSGVTPPVSEPNETGNSGHESPARRRPRMPEPASLLAKLPTAKLPTDKISMDTLPLDRLSADGLQVDKLRMLTKRRPEVGLGLAFAGGLVIATILKRLGRR